MENFKENYFDEPEDDSFEWTLLRNESITASDVAAAVGLSKQALPRALWEVKTGLIQRNNSSEATLHGNRWEDRVRGWYADHLRVRVDPAELRWHSDPRFPFVGATPDGLVITPEGKRLLEIKCPLRAALFDFVPVEYMAQIQTQLEVHDASECDLVCASVGERRIRIFRIFRSKIYWRWLAPRLELFWRCVQERQPPTDDDELNGIRWVYQGAHHLARTDYNYGDLARSYSLPRKAFPPKVHYTLVGDEPWQPEAKPGAEDVFATALARPRRPRLSPFLRWAIVIAVVVLLILSWAPMVM